MDPIKREVCWNLFDAFSLYLKYMNWIIWKNRSVWEAIFLNGRSWFEKWGLGETPCKMSEFTEELVKKVPLCLGILHSDCSYNTNKVFTASLAFTYWFYLNVQIKTWKNRAHHTHTEVCMHGCICLNQAV